MIRQSELFGIIRREMKNVAEEVANEAGFYEHCFVDHRAKILTDRIIEVLTPTIDMEDGI